MDNANSNYHAAKAQARHNDHVKYLRMKNVRGREVLVHFETCILPMVMCDGSLRGCARVTTVCASTMSESSRASVEAHPHRCHNTALTLYIPPEAGTHTLLPSGTPGASLILRPQRLAQKGGTRGQICLGQLGG